MHMNMVQFAGSYPLHETPPPAGDTPIDELLAESRGWSSQFETTLHGVCIGELPDELTPLPDLRNYKTWEKEHVGDGFYALEEHGRDGLQVIDSHLFHHLSLSLYRLWQPLTCESGGWRNEQQRDQAFDMAESDLAFDALVYLRHRYEAVDDVGDELWDDDGTNALHVTLRGMVRKLDAAIVAVKAARQHPGLTVVPAPMPSVLSDQPKSDLIVVDADRRRAVGVMLDAGSDVGETCDEHGDVISVNIGPLWDTVSAWKAAETRRRKSGRKSRPRRDTSSGAGTETEVREAVPVTPGMISAVVFGRTQARKSTVRASAIARLHSTALDVMAGKRVDYSRFIRATDELIMDAL